MDHMYGDPPIDMEISFFRDQLKRRCESILSRLLEEKFALLVNCPGFTSDLSYTIDTEYY